MRFLTHKELRQTDKRGKKRKKKKPAVLLTDGTPAPRWKWQQKFELPTPRARPARGEAFKPKAVTKVAVIEVDTEEEAYKEARKELEVLARRLGMKKQKAERTTWARKDWEWWECKKPETMYSRSSSPLVEGNAVCGA